VEALFNLVRNRTVTATSRGHFSGVLAMLAGRYATRPPGARHASPGRVNNCSAPAGKRPACDDRRGTIPTGGVRVYLQDAQREWGVDEEFVYETAWAMHSSGHSVWRVTRWITTAPGLPARAACRMPFWRGRNRALHRAGHRVSQFR